MGSIYVICSRQCPNGDGIYTLLYALYKYSTSITNQPTKIPLLNMATCTQSMQRTWWPVASTTIVTGSSSLFPCLYASSSNHDE